MYIQRTRFCIRLIVISSFRFPDLFISYVLYVDAPGVLCYFITVIRVFVNLVFVCGEVVICVCYNVVLWIYYMVYNYLKFGYVVNIVNATVFY